MKRKQTNTPIDPDLQVFLDMLNKPVELPPEPVVNIFNRPRTKSKKTWRKFKIKG